MYSTMLPCSMWNDCCISSSLISNVNFVKQYYNHFMVNCTLGYKILQNNERSYWGKTVPSQTLCLGRHDAVYSGFDSSGGPNEVSLTWDTNSAPSPQLLPDLVSTYSIFCFIPVYSIRWTQKNIYKEQAVICGVLDSVHSSTSNIRTDHLIIFVSTCHL